MHPLLILRSTQKALAVLVQRLGTVEVTNAELRGIDLARLKMDLSEDEQTVTFRYLSDEDIEAEVERLIAEYEAAVASGAAEPLVLDTPDVTADPPPAEA